MSVLYTNRFLLTHQHFLLNHPWWEPQMSSPMSKVPGIFCPGQKIPGNSKHSEQWMRIHCTTFLYNSLVSSTSSSLAIGCQICPAVFVSQLILLPPFPSLTTCLFSRFGIMASLEIVFLAALSTEQTAPWLSSSLCGSHSEQRNPGWAANAQHCTRQAL